MPYDGWLPIAITTTQDNNTTVLWRNTDGTVSLWLVDANLAYNPTWRTAAAKITRTSGMIREAQQPELLTSLAENELAELDRIREEYKMIRSQALREALRRYLAAMRTLPAPEEPSPDELEALREAEEEFARGGGRGLRAVLHDAPTLPSPACGGGLGRGQSG